MGVLAISVAPPEGGRNRIMIYGPKRDRTYIVEFKTRPTPTFTSPRDGRAPNAIYWQNTEVPMRFNPIGNEFAAVVEGIDLCAPLNSAQVATIHAGMDRHAVLV